MNLHFVGGPSPYPMSKQNQHHKEMKENEDTRDHQG